MFVLTEKGEVYVFKISEYIPEMDMIDHFKKREEIRADLKLEEPVLIKDISNIKMISSGSDHFLALTYDGKVYAMGDDTFG
jgi:alpha-tubulin suppressor-like RCC1 family protein